MEREICKESDFSVFLQDKKGKMIFYLTIVKEIEKKSGKSEINENYLYLLVKIGNGDEFCMPFKINEKIDVKVNKEKVKIKKYDCKGECEEIGEGNVSTDVKYEVGIERTENSYVLKGYGSLENVKIYYLERKKKEGIKTFFLSGENCFIDL